MLNLLIKVLIFISLFFLVRKIYIFILAKQISKKISTKMLKEENRDIQKV